MYSGDYGTVEADVTNNEIKMTLYKDRTNKSSGTVAFPFANNMFINGFYPSESVHYALNSNNKSYYPVYNVGVNNNSLRRFSVEQNFGNSVVQKLNETMDTQDDYAGDGNNYNGTYYDDAKNKLGLDKDLKTSEAIRYILGDFDNSGINTINVWKLNQQDFIDMILITMMI